MPTRSGGASWSSARCARPASAGASSASSPPAVDDAEIAAAEARVAVAGAGVVLADWAALARDPGLAGRFEHLVVIDPPPFAHLQALVGAGAGWLHRVDGRAEAEFALGSAADEWPSRASLAALYRELLAAGTGGLDADARAGRALRRRRAHPRSPEAAARWSRVLVDLELAGWSDLGPDPACGSYPRGDGTSALRGVRRLPKELGGRVGRFLSERRQSQRRPTGRGLP